MKKYTVVYTAYCRYQRGGLEAFGEYSSSRVDYIQGKTLDDAMKGHVKHLKGWGIHSMHGEPVFFEGHIKQVDIGHGVGHKLGSHTLPKNVIITGINNSKKIKYDYPNSQKEKESLNDN